jgi:hypothetical protein
VPLGPALVPALLVSASSLPHSGSAAPSGSASALGGPSAVALSPVESDALAAWAMVLNAMSGGLAAQPKLSGERVFIGNGLPSNPKTLLDKIERFEFIDLAELLPSNSWHDQITEARAKFTLFPGCELVKPKRKQLETITEWVKAFLIYMAAIAQKHSSMVTELLAYQLTTIKEYTTVCSGGPMIHISEWPPRRQVTGHGPSWTWIYTHDSLQAAQKR